MDQTLTPVSPPIGIFPQYILDRPITLVLKEKVLSWSGSDFGIKDLDGNLLLGCEGKFPSLHGKKVITDIDGNTLYYLRREILVLHKRYSADNGPGQEVFRIRKEIHMKAKMECKFTDHHTQSPSFISLRGGIRESQIHRDFWNKREFAAKQTYYVIVASGVDIALIAGICICFDEAMNDGPRGGASYGGGGGGG